MEKKTKSKGIKSISARLINEKLPLLWQRFPFSSLLVIGLSTLFFIAVNKDFGYISIQLWSFFSLGILLVTSATLLVEDSWSRLKTAGLMVLLLVLCGIYSYFLPAQWNELTITKKIEIWVIGSALFLSLFFISYLKRNRDRSFWNFATQMFFQLVLSGIFGLILFGGLSLAMQAIKSLFNVIVSDRVYGHLAVICLSLFGPIYFLANIPYNAEKHNENVELTKTGKLLALYILTPILAIYTLILYAYLFKIILAWELPNGWVSWLVSALGLGGLLVISLLFPSRQLEKNKVVGFLSRWFGLLILPLLVLMTIGIFRRISDYGITINRGYILLLNIWLYGIYIYLFLVNSRHIKWILISSTIVALMTSVSVWSIARITKHSLSNEVSQVLHKQVSNDEARAIFSKMKPDKKERMKSALQYLSKNYGMQSIQPFFKDSIPGNYWSFLSEMKLEEVLVDRTSIGYYYDKKAHLKITGYNNFLQIDYFQYNESNAASYQIKNDTFKIVIENRRITIPLKESAKQYIPDMKNNNSSKEWVITGDDYQLFINQFSGNYYPEKDSLYIGNLSGFLFYK